MRIAAFIVLIAAALTLQPATGFAGKPSRLSEADWQREVIVRFEKGANAPNVSPQTKASIEAAESYFNALCHLDAWLGTKEAHVFVDQEAERQNRVLVAMQHALDRQNAAKP